MIARRRGPARTCALWCPDWPVVAARRRDPALGRRRRSWSTERGPRGKVVRVGVGRSAGRGGGASGCAAREAEARCAGLVVLDADDTADARAFELVVRAVEELVPRLVLERPGQLSFPTRGPSRYFGGDDALGRAHRRPCARARRRRRARRHRRRHVRGRARGAGHRGARAATRWWCPPGESPAFLAPWPVTVLAGSVDAAHGGGTDLVDLLARLGLRTLGAFAALPAAVGARPLRPSRRARAPARARRGGARAGGDRPARGAARGDRARPAGDARRRSRVRGEDARRPAAGPPRRARAVLRACDRGGGDRARRAAHPRAGATRARSRRRRWSTRVRWQLDALAADRRP